MIDSAALSRFNKIFTLIMKRIYLSLIMASVAALSHANPPGNNGGGNGGCGVGQQTNGCGGQGGAGGAGGSATGVGVGIGVGIAGASSHAAAAATGGAAAVVGSGNSQAAGGAGGSAYAAGGQGSGNTTGVSVDASTLIERSAPAIAVQGGTPLPTGCRYVFGIGGSNANGSVGASGIPLWKDSECKGAAVFGAASRFPGVFTVADLRQVACENFDAMENTPTCRDLRSRQRAEAEAKREQSVAYYGN